ncbi:hypothetical protein H6776_00505 [Candidatus Nomurabacteria bacterium]|nr:hypothetical protein [Candidatus Nomurabacteria bacterium]
MDDYSVEDCWDCPGREDEESSDDSHGDNKHYDDVYYNPGNQAVTPSTTTNNYYYYNNNNNSNTNVVPVAPYIVYPYYNQQYGYRYYSPYHYYYGNQGYYMGGSNPKATIVVNGAKFFLQASFAFNTRPTYDRWYQQNRQWCPLEWISLK